MCLIRARAKLCRKVDLASQTWVALTYTKVQLVLRVFTFTFIYLADAFIQSDLQLHSGYTFLISMCVPWECNILLISQQIRILHKTNTKFKNYWIVGLLESMLIYCTCTQYLLGTPFALITLSIRCGVEVIILWHRWGGMEAQVSLTVAYRFSMEFRCGEFAGQSSTPTPWLFNQLLVLLAVWAGDKSCWKMKSASLKSCSAEGSKECSEMYFVNGCSDVGFQKTQWTNTSRWHCTPNHQSTCYELLHPSSRL